MKKTILFVILWCSLFVNTASAQVCPGFPARGVQIIDALFQPGLAFGSDDERRALTRTFIEQLVFEFPMSGYTWKSADPGRPPSKDSIAQNVGGRLCNWDWQNGSTRLRSVQAGQQGEDITGQNPLPIAGVNHLGGGGTPVPPPVVTPPGTEPQPPVTIDLTAVLKRLDALKEQEEALYAQQERMFADEAARLAAHDARLQQHAAETKGFIDAVQSFFSDGKTLGVIAGLVGGIFIPR